MTLHKAPEEWFTHTAKAVAATGAGFHSVAAQPIFRRQVQNAIRGPCRLNAHARTHAVTVVVVTVVRFI